MIRARGEYRLVATVPIGAHRRLFRIDGDKTPHPTRHSLQIGKDLHLSLNAGRSTDEILDRFYWRFMNHHCDPNTMIRRQSVIALRPIAPWEDVTFNYNTTEFDMAEPFECRCGSPHCAGTIRGARHMRPEERARLRPVFLRCLRADLLAAFEGE